LGNNQVAQLLGGAQSQPSRWKRGEAIGAEKARRLIHFEYVLRRLFTSSLHEDEVTEWLKVRF